MKTWVCSKCGSANSLSRLVWVDGWEGIHVFDNDNGSPEAVDTGEQGVEWGNSEFRTFHCSECEQECSSLTEAVKERFEAECRECGFAGDPADHPRNCRGELIGAPPHQVHPDQARLAVNP